MFTKKNAEQPIERVISESEVSETDLACPNCGNQQINVQGVFVTEFNQSTDKGSFSGQPEPSKETKRYIDALECERCGHKHWVEPDWAATLRVKNAELTIQLAKLLGFEPANYLPS